MSKRIVVFLSLFLIAGLVLGGCSRGAPAIVAEPDAFDFGDIPAAEPVTGTVALHNTGNKPLEIGELRTSCGCTSAQVADTTVAPGATTSLDITFDPQAHPGLYGPLMRIVYVKSNDPQTPELEITVTVNVLEPQEVGQ